MRHWTEEQKQRQAELIRTWQPWSKSTGPRTSAGKAMSAQNVVVGQRRRQKELEQARAELEAAKAKIRRLTRKKAKLNDLELLVQALGYHDI